MSFKKKLNICMVSDFFYPNTGGVETHIYCISKSLIKQGEKVIVITHSYGNRKGIRWMKGGVKVYYLPLPIVYQNVTYPIPLVLLPIIRNILIREQIDIVHGHQSMSALVHETIITAKFLGLKTVFTDHSLFGVSKLENIIVNRILEFMFVDTDCIISVSNVSRENIIVRTNISPEKVFVIPNAIIPSQFTPGIKPIDKKKIKIVVICRLFYRKGVDFLIKIIPKICAYDNTVSFLIAGEGPKKIELEQMIEENNLQKKVELVLAYTPEQVRNVLIKGDIFLNTSLTEAFCIGILEAASCGLLIVSTSVGGIPEILPGYILMLSKPTIDSIFLTLTNAIYKIKTESFNKLKRHNEIKKMYSWNLVSRRIRKVYEEAEKTKPQTLKKRILKRIQISKMSGFFFSIFIVFGNILYNILEKIFPRNTIDICPSIS